MPVSVQFMPTDMEEARFVVREIQRLQARGEARPQDCAVLYRTNAQSRLLERAFTERGILYQVIGGPKFYDRKEIRDLLAYLRLIANPNDEASLKRIVNVPPRGLGDKSLDELERFAHGQSISMWQAMEQVDFIGALTPRAVAGFKNFHHFMSDLMDASAKVPLVALLELVIDHTGFRAYVNPDESLEGQDRWENVVSLLTQASNFSPMEEELGLSQFLDEVALVSDQDTIEDKTKSVTLITLHAAKGLEFPVVFITGMSENIFPHRRVLDDPVQMEEERRLCYVGMTRAKRRLYLIHAERRAQYGAAFEESAPSRFLLSMPQQLLTSPYGPNKNASPGQLGAGQLCSAQQPAA